MAFTVDDFQDLLRLLEQHPEWRAQLRQHILPDELVQLPEVVRSLADAQLRTNEQLATLTERVDALAQRLDELTQRVDALAQRLDELTQRVDALARRVDELAQRVDALTMQLQSLVSRVGDIDGDVLELRFARRAPAYLGRIARRIRVLDPSRLADLLDDAVEAGQLTDPERDAIMLADVVATGRRRGDGAEVYVVTEVSAGIGVSDVRRVLERSRQLAVLGRPVIPIVAGRWINDDAQEYARHDGVEPILIPRKRSDPEPESRAVGGV